MFSSNDKLMLFAFDREFHLTRNQLSLSKVLSAGLSGNFLEQEEFHLELGDEFYPAFVRIYEYLLDPKANFLIKTFDNACKKIEYRSRIPIDDINRLLELADYLVIPELIDLILKILKLDSYTRSQNISILIKFTYLDIFTQKRKDDLFKHYIWKDQSKNVKEILELLFEENLAFHITPLTIDKRKLLSFMPRGWARLCQKDDRPIIIKDWSILPELIKLGKKFALIRDEKEKKHYIMSPGKKEINYREIKGQRLPFCGTISELPSLDQRWGTLKAVVTSQKWVALVNPKHHGDFVIIWRPHFIPELQLIVDLDSI